MSIKDKIGTAAVVGQLVEELSELTAALAKEERRLRGENPTPCTEQECMAAIREEVSDVLNCIGELQDAGYWYDPRVMFDKMKRWERRVAEYDTQEILERAIKGATIFSGRAKSIIEDMKNYEVDKGPGFGLDTLANIGRFAETIKKSAEAKTDEEGGEAND